MLVRIEGAAFFHRPLTDRKKSVLRSFHVIQGVRIQGKTPTPPHILPLTLQCLCNLLFEIMEDLFEFRWIIDVCRQLFQPLFHLLDRILGQVMAAHKIWLL